PSRRCNWAFSPECGCTTRPATRRVRSNIPVVNWLLAAGTLAAVLMFGSSDALGGAYGIAVSMLMAVTTVLAALVALKWGYNPVLVAGVNGLFLIVYVIFVAANATTLIAAGWFLMLPAGIV